MIVQSWFSKAFSLVLLLQNGLLSEIHCILDTARSSAPYLVERMAGAVRSLTNLTPGGSGVRAQYQLTGCGAVGNHFLSLASVFPLVSEGNSVLSKWCPLLWV